MQTQILIGLFFCHLVADYTHLSTSWMLNAKRFGTPLFPIFIHAFVHAILMSIFLESYFLYTITDYNPLEWNFSMVDKLFLLQLITHFSIDTWKGKMSSWFPKIQSPSNKWHWVVFGIDQYLHTLVIIVMSFYSVS